MPPLRQRATLRLDLPAIGANIDEDARLAELSRICGDVVDNLCNEDAELYGRDLDAWLDAPGGADSDTIAKVQMLRDLPSPYGFMVFGFELIKHCLPRGPALVVEGEVDLLQDHMDLADPAVLRAYSELLARQGLPKLAERTARLAARAQAGAWA